MSGEGLNLAGSILFGKFSLIAVKLHLKNKQDLSMYRRVCITHACASQIKFYQNIVPDTDANVDVDHRESVAPVASYR